MKPRILLAEDNAGDVYFIRRALDKHLKTYDLEVVSDGREALSLLYQMDSDALPAPDVVLLDLNLPGVHGSKLLAYLKASIRLTRVPVIVSTSSDAPSDRADVARRGASYFKKPIDVSAFMKIGELVVHTLEQAGRPGGDHAAIA
ncbi:MAG: response regulator [Bryobacteraceae bacterium]